jgi:transcription elongation GreA/GreB family factor
MPPLSPVSAAPEFDEACRRILSVAKEGKAGDFAAFWHVSSAGFPPTTPLFYDRLLAVSKKNAGMLSTVTGVLTENLGRLAQEGRQRDMLRTILEAGPHFGGLTDMRSLALKAVRDLHGRTPDFEKVLEASAMATDKVPVETGIRRLNGLLRLTPGRVYTHKQFGEGVIRSLDLKAGKVLIDFANEKGRPFNFEGVKQFLTYRAPETFLARRAAAPEGLRDMAESDPVGLVKLALESHNRTLKQGELKSLLLAGLMTDSQWTSWWARVRPQLRLDPYLDTDAKVGAHATITLRDRPRTLEEEVRDLFFGAEDSPADRAGAVDLLAKAVRQGNTSVPYDLMKALLHEVEHTAKNHRSAEGRIQDAFLVSDLLGLLDKSTALAWPATLPKADQLIDKLSDDYGVVAAMEPEDHALRALRLAIQRDGGDLAVTRAARALPLMPARVAAAIWKDFDGDEEHRQQLSPVLQSVVDQPLRNPDLFFWAIKIILDDEIAGHLHEQFPPSSFVPELLGTLEQLFQEGEGGSVGRDRDRAAEAKALASRVRTFLAAKKFDVLCRAAEQMSVDQVNRLRKQVQNHPAFHESMKVEADKQLGMTRRDADVVAAQQSAAAAVSKSSTDIPAHVPMELRPDQDLHWTTPAGRLAKFQELEELRTVKIPHNQAEIEKARSEGDLRENAGYTYAKEMQKVLMAQLAKMQRDIATARDYEPGKVNLGQIGFGVRFTARNLHEGVEETYTVFGKFEADADRNIISYQAPFALQFLGRKLDEQFTVRRVDGREVGYQVLRIESALE